MKYIPLNNQPNVSRTRSESISPSLKLDSRSFPHITWLEKQLGRYSFNYEYWDGLKWSYKDFPEVYISEEEIVSSPNSIVLDDNEDPVVTFARKIGSGNRLTLASYNDGWNFNNLDVDYDLNWIGVTKNKRGIEYSSSSSSSSSYIREWTSSSSSSSSSSDSSESSSSKSSKSSKSSNSSSSSSSSSSSPSSSSPSSSSSSSSYVEEWTSSSSSSSSSSYIENWTSSSSSTSSGVLGAWVAETYSGLVPSGLYAFYNDSFSVVEVRSLPTSTNVWGKDYKIDGYYVLNYIPLASKIRKYSYSGDLLNEYNVPSLSLSYGGGYVDIAVDEINSVAYLSSYREYSQKDSIIQKVDLNTGLILQSRTFPNVIFMFSGLFFNGESIYAFFSDQIIRMNSSLVTTATKEMPTYEVVDGYLENDFWYISSRGIYTYAWVTKYTNDGDMPGEPISGAYNLQGSLGYFGRVDDYHEASSSSESSEALHELFVTSEGGLESDATFTFYDASFNLVETRTLPSSFSYGKDYKTDGYWLTVTNLNSIRKYNWNGFLVNTYTYPNIPSSCEDMAVDEVNGYAYFINNSILTRINLSTGEMLTASTLNNGNGLFFDGDFIYVFGGSPSERVEKLTSSLVHVATSAGLGLDLYDGYLENDYWYLSELTSPGNATIYKFTSGLNNLPDINLGVVGQMFYTAGRFGATKVLLEASSSSSSSSLSSDSSSSLSSSSLSSDSSLSDSSNSVSSLSSSSHSSSSSSFGYSESSSSSSIDSRSSSSSSSYDDSPYFVTIYDTTNSEFKIYSVGTSWYLLGSQAALPNSCIKIDDCESHIGIGFIDSNTNIQCNFFNVNAESWAFPVQFNVLVASQTYNNILDMDLAGYNIEDDSFLTIGWLSKQSEHFYVCNELVDSKGIEMPTDYTSVVVEDNNVDVVSDYVSNGYNKISVYKDGNFYGMFAMGSSCKYFLNYNRTNWGKEFVDISCAGNGMVCESIRNQNGRIVFGSDSGDIYYFESDPIDPGFSVSTADMVLLNDKWAKRVEFKNGTMDGIDISGSYDNNCGSILMDSIKKVSTISNKVPAPATTTTTTLVPTTTTTTTSIYCTNPVTCFGSTLCNYFTSWDLRLDKDEIGACMAYVWVRYHSNFMGIGIYSDSYFTNWVTGAEGLYSGVSHKLYFSYGRGTVIWDGINRFTPFNPGANDYYGILFLT